MNWMYPYLSVSLTALYTRNTQMLFILDATFPSQVYRYTGIRFTQGSNPLRTSSRFVFRFCTLVVGLLFPLQNYRSHPAILMPPSAMFYNDSLQPCASNGLISWAGLKNNKFPLTFLGCDTKEENLDEVCGLRATEYAI